MIGIIPSDVAHTSGPWRVDKLARVARVPRPAGVPEVDEYEPMRFLVASQGELVAVFARNSIENVARGKDRIDLHSVMMVVLLRVVVVYFFSAREAAHGGEHCQPMLRDDSGRFPGSK